VSSTKVEYIVVFTQRCEVICLKKLLLELGVMEKIHTLIYCDNQSCVKLENNPMFHDRSKHNEFGYHYIRDLRNKKEIYMEYCSIEYNVADILMKALPKPKFEYYRIGLGLCVVFVYLALSSRGSVRK
jgi:hypothetical protein